MRKVELHSVDVGFSRVNYKFKGNRYPSFCLQEEGRGKFVFFSLSGGDEPEPDSPIRPRRDVEIPLPTGKDPFSTSAREWLEKWKVGEEEGTVTQD